MNKTTVSALLAGLVFGLGLIVAGMANPAKVLGFLDLAGRWDPSLALVMMGAIAAAFIPFRLMQGRSHSLLGEPARIPAPSARLTPRLLGGSLLFGIGWGLAGICPGPGLVLAGAGLWQGWIYLAGMAAGMGLVMAVERLGGRQAA